MFLASSAHLQEDTVVHMQHIILTLYESSWWLVGTQLTLCTYKPPGTLIESDYHMLHVYNCIVLRMST